MIYNRIASGGYAEKKMKQSQSKGMQQTRTKLVQDKVQEESRRLEQPCCHSSSSEKPSASTGMNNFQKSKIVIISKAHFQRSLTTEIILYNILLLLLLLQLLQNWCLPIRLSIIHRTSIFFPGSIPLYWEYKSVYFNPHQHGKSP